jgi:16S rRNA (cytidine1402-2'-O)-methyltransferase
MEQEADHRQAATGAPSLYVVATPIGNLADITLRALATLKSVDAVAAEDTRVTARLLAHHGIDARVIALHAHNERRAAHKILELLAQGKSVALVSDAGTPGISDPGAIAVAMARAAGFCVVPVPGPNAAACALSAAGSPAPHFVFYGFLPSQAAARRRELTVLSSLPYLLVFYEAPHRVAASVRDMADAFGAARTVTIARELTKLFETIHVCALGEAAAWLDADANRVRGEFVLLVEGAPAADTAPGAAAARTLQVLLRELPLKQAVKLAAELGAGKRNDLYQLALEMQNAEK